jgi:prepilin-type N-terminal cleavage/methylation domain-containing protein
MFLALYGNGGVIMNRRCRGFTIIELLVVIGIMGVMIAISVPFYAGYRPRLLLSQAGNSVLGAVRIARQLAVSEARNHTVYLDFTNERFKVDSGQWKPLGIQIDMAKGTGWTADSISFGPDGRSTTSGKILFSSGRTKEKFELYVSVAGFTKLQQK